MFDKRSRLVIIVAFFLFVFALYVKNITQDVYSGDIGDLATAAITFGVPHPPGYPTLTLLGFLFSKLPLPLPLISRVALVSVFAALAGAILYFRLAMQESKSLFASLFATSVLAFSYYYWLYAEIPEVFALSNFFLIGIYYFAWQFHIFKRIRDVYLCVFFIALSLTNQQAIIATFPGIFVLLLPDAWKFFKGKYLIKEGVLKSVKSKNAKTQRMVVLRNVVALFLVGLLPYLYVFVSASTNPQINWMQEPTINNFVRLILRQDYEFGTDLIPFDQRLVVTNVYVTAFINTLSFITIIVCVIGMIVLYKRHRWLLLSLLTGFIFSGPLFIFIIAPRIQDQDQFGVLERFFIHSFVLFLFFLPAGLAGIQTVVKKYLHREMYAILFLLPLLIVPYELLNFNSKKTDLSQTKIGYYLAADLISPLPKNAIIFLKSDSVTFNTWYVHHVLGLRPDVSLVSRAGDRNPLLNLQTIREYQKKFPEKKISEIEANTALLIELMKDRPVFSTYMFSVASREYIWLPRGLTYQLVSIKDLPTEKEYIDTIQSDLHKLHVPYRHKLKLSEQNLITPNIARVYAGSVVAMGDALFVFFNDPRRALAYYNYAQVIDGDNSVVYAKLGIAQGELPGRCDAAVENMKAAIDIYKIYKPYYTYALKVYKKCRMPDNEMMKLKQNYKSLFGKDLEKDLHY